MDNILLKFIYPIVSGFTHNFYWIRVLYPDPKISSINYYGLIYLVVGSSGTNTLDNIGLRYF